MRCKSVKDCSIHVHERISFPMISVCVLSHFSCVHLLAIPWTVAHQPPLSMGFSRQEYWSGLPFPSPGGLPEPRDQTRISYTSRIGNGFFTTSATLSPDLTSDHKHDHVIMLAYSTSWSQTLYSLNLVGGYTRNLIAEKR